MRIVVYWGLNSDLRSPCNEDRSILGSKLHFRSPYNTDRSIFTPMGPCYGPVGFRRGLFYGQLFFILYMMGTKDSRLGARGPWHGL